MTRIDLTQYALFAEPTPAGEDFSVVHLLPRAGIHALDVTCWCHPEELEDRDPTETFGEDVTVVVHRAFAPRWG